MGNLETLSQGHALHSDAELYIQRGLMTQGRYAQRKGDAILGIRRLSSETGLSPAPGLLVLNN